MDVKKVHIPDDMLIKQYLPADYTDAFQCQIVSDTIVNADDVQVAFWTDSPRWVDALMLLRDRIVRIFGIQGGMSEGSKEKFIDCIRSGGTYRYINVPVKSENETILCLNDKHLKAYVSVRVTTQEANIYLVQIGTAVFFHNLLGRIYFLIIFPLHCLVVPRTLRHALRQL